MLSPGEIAPTRVFPLTRERYHQLGELGAFEGRRVQLVYGTIIDMSPMGPPHRDAVRVLTRYLAQRAPADFDLMVQLPLELSDDSEPEPDFSLVPRLGSAEDEPSPRAVLAIEVADSSKKLDLGPKARLYAESKIPEYWVIDLNAREVVVHRSPQKSRYGSVRRHAWSKELTSHAIPELTVRLSEVLDAIFVKR